MRKTLLLILVLLLTLVCAGASADTEYSLGEGISGKISLNEASYIVLTPENLSEHPDLLTGIGKTAEDLQADWTACGVLLQGWTKDMKTSVEISVFQDDLSSRYYDLESTANTTRKQYYKEQLDVLKQQGYRINDSEMKLHKSGHYVGITYVRSDGGTTRRGVLRRTIRNGYVLQMDY